MKKSHVVECHSEEDENYVRQLMKQLFNVSFAAGVIVGKYPIPYGINLNDGSGKSIYLLHGPISYYKSNHLDDCEIISIDQFKELYAPEDLIQTSQKEIYKELTLAWIKLNNAKIGDTVKIINVCPAINGINPMLQMQCLLGSFGKITDFDPRGHIKVDDKFLWSYIHLEKVVKRTKIPVIITSFNLPNTKHEKFEIIVSKGYTDIKGFGSFSFEQLKEFVELSDKAMGLGISIFYSSGYTIGRTDICKIKLAISELEKECK